MTLEIVIQTTKRKKVQAHQESKEETLLKLGRLEDTLILYEEMYRKELHLIEQTQEYRRLSPIIQKSIKDQKLDMYRITYLIDKKIGQLYTEEHKGSTKLIPKQRLTDGQGGCDRMYVTDYTKEFTSHTEKKLIKESGIDVFDTEMKQKVKQYKDLLDEFRGEEELTIKMVLDRWQESAKFAYGGAELIGEMITQVKKVREKVEQRELIEKGPKTFYK